MSLRWNIEDTNHFRMVEAEDRKPDGQRSQKHIDFLNQLTEIVTLSTMLTYTGSFVSVEVAREHFNRIRWYESLHGKFGLWPNVPVGDSDLVARYGRSSVPMFGWDQIDPADWVGLTVNVEHLSRSAWFKRIGAIDPCTQANYRKFRQASVVIEEAS